MKKTTKHLGTYRREVGVDAAAGSHRTRTTVHGVQCDGGYNRRCVRHGGKVVGGSSFSSKETGNMQPPLLCLLTLIFAARTVSAVVSTVADTTAADSSWAAPSPGMLFLQFDRHEQRNQQHQQRWRSHRRTARTMTTARTMSMTTAQKNDRSVGSAWMIMPIAKRSRRLHRHHRDNSGSFNNLISTSSGRASPFLVRESTSTTATNDRSTFFQQRLGGEPSLQKLQQLRPPTPWVGGASRHRQPNRRGAAAAAAALSASPTSSEPASSSPPPSSPARSKQEEGEEQQRPQQQRSQRQPGKRDEDDESREGLLETLTACQFPVEDFGGLKYWNTASSTATGSRSALFRTAFVLGGPGAGKGTQSSLMAENYPCVHLSVGQLLRDEEKDMDSPYREIIEDCLVTGQIVPVDISINLLLKAMRRNVISHGISTLFLVDGFPRNEDNLIGWCRCMRNVAALWTVLVYQCPLQVLEQRILQRGKESGRSDDNVRSVQKRFETFERDTIPIVNQLRDLADQQQQQILEIQSGSAIKPSKDGINCTGNESPAWKVEDIRGDESLEDVWSSTQQVLNRLIVHDVLSANAALLLSIRRGDGESYRNLCDPSWFVKEAKRKRRNDRNDGRSDSALTPKVSGDPIQVMKHHEGDEVVGTNVRIRNASVEVVGGRQVAVTYLRTIPYHDHEDADQGADSNNNKNSTNSDDVDGVDGVAWIMEKRIWTHQGPRGWRNVHYIRTPACV